MIDQRFGDWLAGFIDGEGTFVIHRSNAGKGHPSWGCKLIVKLRDDDGAILDQVAERTGLGRVYWKRPGGGGRNSKAQVAWSVQSKEDCLGVVRLLDAHPLRAKKRHDYAVWRAAVLMWVGVYSYGNRRQENDLAWACMAALAQQIRDVREYRPGESPRLRHRPVQGRLEVAA